MEQQNESQAAPRGLMAGLAFLALLLVLGISMAVRSANEDRNRALDLLEQEAAVTVEGQVQALSGWLSAQRSVVDAIATNPSVGIYVTGRQNGAVGAGQVEYLRALLQTAAQRSGFAQANPRPAANVQIPEAAGLAILAPDGQPIASFGGPLPAPGLLVAKANKGPVMEARAKLGRQPALALAAPILDPQSGTVVALVYGVKSLDEVEALLTSSAERFRSARTALADQQGILAGSRTMPANDRLERAARSLGTLVQSEATLLLAQKVPGTPWRIIRALDAEEALAPIENERRLRLVSLIATIFCVAALALLAWRHVAAQRAAVVAAHEATLRQFLQTIADQQRALIGVVDARGFLRFSNARLAQWMGGDSGQGQGAHLARMMGPAEPMIANLIDGAQLGKTGEVQVTLLDPQGHARQLQMEVTPMEGAEVLIVAHDITELLMERARREANMAALVSTLTGLIDARDPGSQRHSEKVSALVTAMGEELSYSPEVVETLRLSGLLLNLGKIMVPRAILTKAGPLTEEERVQVRDALTQSARILSAVPFDGPVSELISGVEDASPSPLSRILKLCNAFVGMVSPRSFREPLSVDEALELLREQALVPDHAVLSALAHVLDNRGGRSILER